MNGVSKKLCVITNCISGVLGLAANAENKLPYAIVVGSVVVFYMICQVLLDWKK